MGEYIAIRPPVLKAGQLKYNWTQVNRKMRRDADRSLKSGTNNTKTLSNETFHRIAFASGELVAMCIKN
jgi:hypothetical protein